MEVINDDHDYMDMQFYNILYTRAKNKFFYEKMVIYCEKWFLMYVCGSIRYECKGFSCFIRIFFSFSNMTHLFINISKTCFFGENFFRTPNHEK